MLGLFCSFLGRKAFVARTSALVVAFGLCFGLLVVDTLFRGLVAPEMRGYSAMDAMFNTGYFGGYGGVRDYGYFGVPAVTWFSPLFVLSVVSDWTESAHASAYAYGGDADVWSAHPSSVLLVYSLSLVAAVCFCLYYVLTRYRRDVRGGRPLGEPIS